DSDSDSGSNNGSNNGSDNGSDKDSNSGSESDNSTKVLPKAGASNESSLLTSLGALFAALGSSLLFFNRRKKNTK
ncbi:LPXTG cell wall anchor domain-containing protein, partial [Bacillus cereus]|uniref:LPXTG cell wall anchor domain-containing protein n=1 Tax=Bacillus cereus TaxID=1396 RepID=UPI0011455B34